jgi:hypothetical protein
MKFSNCLATVAALTASVVTALPATTDSDANVRAFEKVDAQDTIVLEKRLMSWPLFHNRCDPADWKCDLYCWGKENADTTVCQLRSALKRNKNTQLSKFPPEQHDQRIVREVVGKWCEDLIKPSPEYAGRTVQMTREEAMIEYPICKEWMDRHGMAEFERVTLPYEWWCNLHIEKTKEETSGYYLKRFSALAGGREICEVICSGCEERFTKVVGCVHYLRLVVMFTNYQPPIFPAPSISTMASYSHETTAILRKPRNQHPLVSQFEVAKQYDSLGK